MTNSKDVMIQEQYRQEAIQAAHHYRLVMEAKQYARQNQTSLHLVTRLLNTVMRVLRQLLGQRPSASGRVLRPQH